MIKYPNQARLWLDAVRDGDAATARQVLDEHPELLASNEDAGFLAQYAVRYFHYEPLADLFARGVDVNIDFTPDHPSRPDTPLFEAVLGSYKDIERGREMVRWLLARGARATFGPDGGSYPYPLVQAIKEGDLEIVRMLADVTPDLNTLGELNESPLSYAIGYGQHEIAAYLRSKGAKESHEIPGYVPPPPPDPVPDHVAAMVGPVEARGWVPIVPDGEPPVAIRAATRDDGTVCLFTDGMSAQPMPPGPGGDSYSHAELALYLAGWPDDPERWLEPQFRWPLDWLRRLARHPFDTGRGFGGPVAVVANGEPPQPLGPGTALTCWLLLADKEPLGRFEAPDGRDVVFYELVPIHTAERAFERAHGTAALLERFAQHEVPEHIDPNRKSVV
ncbi:MAG TPA: suppressor of fused domain protein [Gemmata sp.]